MALFLNTNYYVRAHTSDVKIGAVRVGDADAVFSNTFVFAFVRLETVPYLQRTWNDRQQLPSSIITSPYCMYPTRYVVSWAPTSQQPTSCRFSRFCMAHSRDQQKDRQTDEQSTLLRR